MGYETLLYDVDDHGVATISLNQPDTRNALSDALIDLRVPIAMNGASGPAGATWVDAAQGSRVRRRPMISSPSRTKNVYPRPRRSRPPARPVSRPSRASASRARSPHCSAVTSTESAQALWLSA